MPEPEEGKKGEGLHEQEAAEERTADGLHAFERNRFRALRDDRSRREQIGYTRCRQGHRDDEQAVIDHGANAAREGRRGQFDGDVGC